MGTSAHSAGSVVVEPAGSSLDPLVERYAGAHPSATLYHLPAFRRVIERAAGLRATTFVARRSPAGPVVGILPVALTRGIFGTYATSLPYFNYGGVLADDAVAGRALVDAAWDWAGSQGADHIILRHTADRPLDLPDGHLKETVVLAIPPGGPEAIWEAIGPKPRNLIRKAERLGLVAAAGGAELLGEFHAVYAATLRDHGTPHLGLRLFECIFEELGAGARVHVVRDGAKAVAAAVTLRFRGRIEAPWAGTLRVYRPTAANMLLYGSVLAYAAAADASLFDFGRSTPGSGPYRFKLQWRGARAMSLPWYWLSRDGRSPVGELSPSNAKYRWAIAIWKRLPRAVTRRLGPPLARVLP